MDNAQPGLRLRRETSLADFLSEVPAAAEVILPELLNSSAIQAARLTCKALRHFVDENVRCLRVTVLEVHAYLWPMRKPPSLERWPNCSSIRLSLKMPQSRHGFAPPHQTLTHMAVMPFMGLGHAASQRIRSLHLNVPLPTSLLCSCEDAVRAAVGLLPNLQSIDLSEAVALSYNSFEQELMCSTIAMLPRLEGLILPSALALDHIGALARGPAGSSLKKLTVAGMGDDQHPLTREAVEGLSRLSRLERVVLIEVRLRGEDEDEPHQSRVVTLTDLLDGLPVSLQTLHLSSRKWRSCKFHLTSGRLQTMSVCQCPHSIPEIACLAEQVLGSRIMLSNPNQPGEQQQQQVHRCQHKLEQLWLHSVRVPDDAALSDLKPPALMELLRRSEEIIIDNLDVKSSAQIPVLADMFGKPSSLSRHCFVYWAELDLQAEDSWVWAPSDPAADPGFVLPSMEQVAERLVQRLIRGPAGTAIDGSCGGGAGTLPGVDAGEPRRDGAAAACGLLGSPEQRQDYSSTLLVLRGGFISLLAKASIDMVPAWVERMRARSSDAGSAAAREARLVSYIVLPEVTNAAIIDCGTTASTAAFADVLREAANGQPLEVLPVVTGEAREELEDTQRADDDYAACIYCEKLSEVLQDIWDTRWASGAGAALGEVELLRQLVKLVDDVREMVGGHRWVDGQLMEFGVD